MTVSKVGDLVWVRVQGHPWWPGQVMDPKKATNEKVVKERKPDHTLISFFGDDSYGWFPTGRDILPFDKHFAAKSKQPASKKDKRFNRACAEGREVHDRRLGKDPATKFRPHDFLHPGWSDDSDDEAAEDRYDDLRPLPVAADKLPDCSTEHALLWLQSVACNPSERPKMSPVKIDGAKRQLFSLVKSQNIKLQAAAQKAQKKKSPSPPAESPAEAATAAEPAASDAAELGQDDRPEEEDKPVAVSQKKKRLQKKSTGSEADNSSALGQTMKRKRKRKEDIDTKADKPKQQRRKPAIAEIKRDEDGDAPTAAAADSADLVEQAAPEVKSDDDADEPVSGSDQEPEPEADTVQKKKRAYNRSKRVSGSYRGPRPRRLKATLPDVVSMLQGMATDPTSDAWKSTGAQGAAWLSFRELVFSYSSFNKAEGELGECTAAALDARDVLWVKVKPQKEKAPAKQYGVPAETRPDLGIEYRHVHYVSKLPESREAFEEQLAEFYSKHGAVLSAPSIMQIPLDLHTIFKGVAERGGYEGVSGTRQWSVVAREWRPEMGSMEAARVKKAYLKLLLAFEQQLSQDCKVEVRKKKSARVKRAGPSGSMEPEDQPVKASKKRKAPSDAAKADSAGPSSAAALPPRTKPQEQEEDSEPEGSEVSYDSDEPQECEESDADSDADNDRRLAKAANDAMLRKLQKEARKESRAEKKKLQKEQGRGSKQRGKREVGSWASDEEDFTETISRTDSGQGGPSAKGKRQSVDSRALATRPGQSGELDEKARAEARARKRAAMANDSARQSNGKSEAWRSGLETMLDSPRSQQRSSQLQPSKADAKTIVILQFREDYALPSKAIIFNVMHHYGALNMQTDIWFNVKKYLVYVQFQHEQDALTAQSVLERRASALFKLPEGSVKRVSLTVPYSANRESSNVVPNPAAVINPRAVSGPPGAAAQRPSAYPAPVQPIANPSANFAINPSHSAPPGAGLSQPTDPRRAAAAKSANLAPATQIGQYPGQPGVGSAEPAGSGQYPMAGPGPGAGLLPGQGGAALPADFRPDPRKAARGASAFRPAGGFPGAAAGSSAPYRPPPPPSLGGLPPAGALPPVGSLPTFAGGYPSRQQWISPAGGLPPHGRIPGGPRPQSYPPYPSMPQRPPSLPSQLPSASTVPHQPSRPYRPIPSHASTPGSPVSRQNGLHRPGAAALPTSPPSHSAGAMPHSPTQQPSPQAPVPSAPALANASGPDAIDMFSILRNAGMANPLASLPGAAAPGAEAAQAAGTMQGLSQPAGGTAGQAADPNVVTGAQDSAAAADAGPVLAGDDTATGAPDVGGNLLALLNALTPAGQ